MGSEKQQAVLGIIGGSGVYDIEGPKTKTGKAHPYHQRRTFY